MCVNHKNLQRTFERNWTEKPVSIIKSRLGKTGLTEQKSDVWKMFPICSIVVHDFLMRDKMIGVSMILVFDIERCENVDMVLFYYIYFWGFYLITHIIPVDTLSETSFSMCRLSYCIPNRNHFSASRRFDPNESHLLKKTYIDRKLYICCHVIMKHLEQSRLPD